MQAQRISVTTFPADALRALRQKTVSTGVDSQRFILDYTFCCSYLPDKPLLPLSALIELQADGRIECLVIPSEVLNQQDAHTPALRDVARKLGAALIDLRKPLLLSPVAIPKPWGQEIWFTGMEARGQASVRTETGQTPLPWVLSLFESGNNLVDNTILLKILDPHPQPVIGDLYFELHEKKQEIYVVTHVDPSAWPDGRGAIRFGFNQQKRAGYTSDESFRSAYLDAVKHYRDIRRKIDTLLDSERARLGFDSNEALAPQTLQSLLDDLPEALQQEELVARTAMEDFTAMLPLQQGDVLAVPCFVPHALQHGVRTVEFQTPVYERKILSFAQKVLTQPEWDTEDALSLCHFGEPERILAEERRRDELCHIERIVDFDDFHVERICLKAGARYHFDVSGGEIVMGLSGCLAMTDGVNLEPEHAMLFPLAAEGVELRAEENCALLLAVPRKPG